MVGDYDRLEVEVSRKKVFRRRFLEAIETPEQREQRVQREAAMQEKQRRRVLAKIRYNPEEFEEACQEFARKFQEGMSSPSLLLADKLGVDKQRVVNTKQHVAAVRSTPNW